MTRPLLAYLNHIDDALSRTGHLLLATDLDGTLCPIVRSPDAARVPPQNVDLLSNLLATRKVTVAVVSGRAIENVMSMVDLPVIFAGNHGLQIRGPNLTFDHSEAMLLMPMLLEACRSLDLSMQRWQGAWVENKGLTATVHFRNVPLAEHHALTLTVRAQMARFGTLFGIRAGKRALEIHPRVGWNKGRALQFIRERLQLMDAACLVVGDDRTDESMFAVSEGELTVHVGRNERTAAHYQVADPSEVTSVLEYTLGATQGARSTQSARSELAHTVG